MFGRGKTIAAAAAICIVVAFACGWSKPAWVKSGITGEGSKRGAWSAVGGSAGWDTVMVIFHPGARVDSTATTGKWLFPIPTAYTGADTVKNPRQNHRIWRLNDKILGRGTYPGGGDWKPGNGDTAHVIRLGTGKAVPTFAWSNIKENDTDGYYPSQYMYMREEVRQVINGVAYTQQQIGCDGGNRTIPMFYIPFEDHIPDRSTIVSASVNFANYSAAYYQAADSVISVLMTNPQDSLWYDVKGGTGLNAASPNYAKASWTYQTDTNAGGTSWGGTQVGQWSPTLAQRNYYWGMGTVSDWSGSTVGSGGFIAAEKGFDLDITDCVQASVAGTTNNGIVCLWESTSNTTSTEPLLYGWDSYSNAATREPYVTVKYITKRYRPVFGTSDLAFVFTTDDFIEKANSAFTDTFNAHGGVYTLFGSRIHVDHPEGKQSGMDSLLTWLAQGHEIGTHSYYHKNPAGLTHWEQSRPGKVWDATARAETYADAKPDWLYALADSATGDSLKAHPYFAKSIALPNNTISMGVQRVLADLGYLSVRGMAVSQSYDRTKYPWAPSWAPAYGDTGMSTTSYAARRPRNMMLLPYSMTTTPLVKRYNTASTAADSVRHNMRRALYQWRGQDRGAFVTLTHDVKSTNALHSGYGYTDGINPDELGAMLDVVDELGVPYMRASEYGRWRRSTGTPIDTPDGYYNAPADDDSARFYAHEGVWYKPDGIDNRLIPGLRDISYARAADNTPPGAPAVYASFAQDSQCAVFWSAAPGEGASHFNVYRFFDNAADTTLLAMVPSAQTYYVDTSAVNGSPHNYFVRARDASGNLSAASSTSRLFPGTIRVIPRPAYWAFWYQDPADGSALAQADVEKLAEFDMIVGSPHSLEGPQLDEVAFDGLLGRIRAINPDFIYLTYYTAFCLYDYWADAPSQSVHKRVWEYAASLPDSSGFGRDADGDVVYGDFYPGQAYCNVMIPSLADTIAKILVETYEGSGTDGEWAGFFLDDSDTTLSEWMCNDLACGDLIDFDQDTTPYSSDDDEQAAFTEWHLRLVKAIRREFAERGMQNRLVVANTTFGRKEEPTADDTAYMGLLDGALNEAWNRYWPGPNVPTDQDGWDLAFGWRNQLVHAQTSPPLMLWNARADSSQQYMNEVLAYAHGGFVNANNDVDWSSASAAPTMGRKNALLAPGLAAVVTYDEVDGGATADTLNVVTGDLTARMVLSRNTGNISDSGAVWPYLIATDTDTLSRSVYWERAGEEGAPAAPQYQTIAGDRSVTMLINATTSDNKVWLPGDFLRFRIIRSHEVEVGSGLDTLYADPDTLDHYNSEDPASDAFLFYDTGLTNGTEYCYSISSEDVLGNRSSEFAPSGQCREPTDTTAPAIPTALKASGGAGYIDLDWLGVSAADLVGYEVSRAPETGDGPGTYAVTDTVAISAHQDSTALESNFYYYRVRALDDDGNASAYAGPALAAWYGDTDPPARPAPSNVMAWPDNPQGRTSVVMYAPADTTGLTGYQVFRGATADTGACVLYKTNVARGMFDGGVFEDLKANSDPDSTWYYTAKAMYGAARSEKFHTMRPALTTGNFPTLVPSVFAYGSGSSLGVAWIGISGADSTLIYRGTTAGSQSLLATVAHTANPYMDATAAANTDYYYRVRLKDNPSTYSDYSAVFGPVRWTSTPSGDPSISTVTGAVSHGSTITIAGSNFGTKATAAPQKYDDFESYSEGATATTADGWSSVDWGGNGPGMPPIYSSTAGHVGKGLMARFENGGSISRVRLDRDWSGGFYIDYWYTHVEAGERSRNLKPWRLYGNGQGSNEFPQFNVLMQCASGSVQLPVSTNTGGPNPYFTSVDNLVGAMRHWQIWAKPDITDGGDGYSNGSLLVMLNGQVVHRNDAWRSNDAACDGNYWYQLSISGYYSRSVDGGSCPSTYITGNAYEYWDNLYIDNTQARVEIGNASTYAACTHREIQIPSAWSATSITCTVNTGSFSSGAAYLFVIDEEGTASAGKPIAISASKQAFDYKHVDYIVGGQSFRIENVDWDTGVTGSMTIRAVEQFSGSVVDEDTSSSGNPAIGPTLTGLVPGTQYRIEYTTDTDDEDYEPKSTWSTLFGPYTQPPKSAEEDGSIGQ